jgi:protein SCO1/2
MNPATASFSRRDFFRGGLSSRSATVAPARFLGPTTTLPGGVPTHDRTSRRFPDCVVRGHLDSSYRLVSDLIADQRVMIGLIYTRCDGICPTTTRNMLAARKILEQREQAPFRMITLSIDPERDTPDDLHRYAAKNQAAQFENWQFVVASPADTLALRRSLRLIDPNPERDRKLNTHSGVLILGNDTTNRWGGIPAAAEPIHIANLFERTARTTSLQEYAGFGKPSA